jgi:PAS domain S-box-containing protein
MSSDSKLRGEALMELEALRARVAELETAKAGLERKLRARTERDERLEAAVRGASDGLWDWSFATGDSWWSPRFRELIGYDEEDLPASYESFQALLHPDDQDRSRRPVRLRFQEGRPYQIEYRLRTKKDGYRWFLSRGAVVRDEAGRPVRFSGSIQDIDERKRIEEERRVLEGQLRQAQKMEAVGQLAAGVAHDFNNILMVILGNAELLLPMLEGGFDEGAGEATRSGLEEIKTAGQRAAAITRQLLAFGRKETIKAEVLEPDRVIRGAEEMLRRLLPGDIVFDVNVAPETRCVRADAGHIEQIVMNVVLNARDAMPGGGTLSVTCVNADLSEAHANAHVGARSGPHVMLVVSDTGVGMTKEMTEHIFEPFFTTKPMGKGTGLGLATVYGIVRQMGGHISVESELERGSTFRVYLPAAQEERADPEAAAAMGESGGDEVILVCEDEERVRQLLCRVLRAAGYTVLEAEDGSAALAVAAGHQGPIHLLVSDVIMPEMDGRKLFQEMVRSRPGMRVMFVSGYTDDVVDPETSWGTGWGFLQKPFSPSTLRERVREMLDQP